MSVCYAYKALLVQLMIRYSGNTEAKVDDYVIRGWDKRGSLSPLPLYRLNCLMRIANLEVQRASRVLTACRMSHDFEVLITVFLQLFPTSSPGHQSYPWSHAYGYVHSV
jgi:hypothetical protein